ncbi:MAG: hypothetical protein ACLT4D_03540 [Blautia faecis]
MGYNDAKWMSFLTSTEDMTTMINVGMADQKFLLLKIATSDCDGPAGLNNFMSDIWYFLPNRGAACTDLNKDL